MLVDNSVKAYVEAKPKSTMMENKQYFISHKFIITSVPLPKCNGDLTMWLNLKNTFDALVCENKAITPIQKFHYLKETLEDIASIVID